MGSKSGSKKGGGKASAKAKAEKRSAEKALKKRRILRKSLLICAIAAWLAAMIVFLVFYVKPHFLEKKNPAPDLSSTVSAARSDKNGDIVFKNVEYRGSMVPDVFVKILEAYETERKSVNAAYGTTATVLGYDISVPEYVFSYHSQYCTLFQDAAAQEQKTGKNNLGLDLSKTPANQTKGSKGIPWSKAISDATISTIQSLYVRFNQALSVGTVLTQEQVNNTVKIYTAAADSAYARKKNVTKYLEEIYTEGVSYTFYQTMVIMNAYVDAYEDACLQNYRNKYTENDLAAEFDSNALSYARADVRIAIIEDMEYEQADVDKVVDLESFYEFAYNENKDIYSEYDPDADTMHFCSKPKTISNGYGQELTDWIFSKDRKSGDINLIKGSFYTFMVYIVRPPYYTYSMDYRVLFVPFLSDWSESEDTEKIEEAKNRIDNYYAEWEKNGKTEDAFAELCRNYSDMDSTYFDGGLLDNTRVGEFDTEVDKWLLKSGRKTGDCERIKLSNGYVLVYYIRTNRDDPDWKEQFLSTSAAEENNAANNALYEQSGNEITQNTDTIAKAILICEKLAQKIINTNM